MTAFGLTPDSLPYKGKVPGSGTGRDGKNAFTALTANFTQPALGASGVASVADSSWAAAGQIVFVAGGGGYYEVIAVPSSTSIRLKNLGYEGNYSAPGTPIPSTSGVTPGGLQGPGQELALGQFFSVSSPAGVLSGTEKYFDINGVISGALPDNRLGGYRINASHTFDTLGATFATTITAPTQITVTLYASTDNGQTYNPVALVVLESGTQTKNATFTLTTFPAGTLFCVGAKTEGSMYAGGLSVTVSRS